MDNIKKKTNGKKIFDIVSWILIALLFLFSLSLVLIRNASGTIYLFNTRYDVVLTKSMSYKNEEHLDFLKGHDDQIQAFDMVRSVKVNNKTELNVYDIVLFNNPYVGTDMHRVIDKKQEGSDDVLFVKVEYTEDKNAFYLPRTESYIYTNGISYTTLEMVIECDEPEYSDAYHFNFQSKLYEPKVQIKKSGDKYIHTITVDKGTSRPGITTIAHKKEFDYHGHLIKSIKFNSYYGSFVVDTSKMVEYEEQEETKLYRTNITYEYQIRGDAAKDDDGWYKIDQIYSKVTNIIPKVGYGIRYLSSAFGIIMLTGTAFIIIIVSFIVEKYDSKNKPKKEEEKNEK